MVVGTNRWPGENAGDARGSVKGRGSNVTQDGRQFAATKMGLRKPRMEVIVSTLRQKRLGSSQPIVAARLVLIRGLHTGRRADVSSL